MTDYTVRAEYDPLDAVRVHEPGLELWSGAVDPGPNLFEDPVPPEQARREHERIVRTLEDAGVEVHHLANDLATAGVLDSLVRETVRVPDGESLGSALETLDAREKLHLALSRARVERETDAASSVHVERPLSNIYFQRDTTVVGDRGPILCNMRKPVRRPEVPIVREAWEGIGADIVHEVTGEPLEGGEFMPVGEFALLGVSAVVDGEEEIVRTSYEGGRQVLDAGAVGYDEVGLVRAPLEADRRLQEKHGRGERVMHLLGWFNVAAEGLAVLDADLARRAEVDVYVNAGGEYRKDRSLSTLDYVREKGYDVVDVAPSERWPTNFIAVDDGVVVPLYEPDDEGRYRPENNPTIEALKERGVTVLPDGEGIPRAALTSGSGGIHCMTTPLRRG
jgi:arginine deiminase